MADREEIKRIMGAAAARRRARTNEQIAEKLEALAGTLTVVTSEDYDENAAELFDGSDIDALRDAAERLRKAVR